MALGFFCLLGVVLLRSGQSFWGLRSHNAWRAVQPIKQVEYLWPMGAEKSAILCETLC